MRLLMTTDAVGGVWRFAQELARGLLETGCAVAMVSFGRQLSDAQRAECRSLSERWSEQFRFVGTDVPLEWMQGNERSFGQGVTVLRRVAREFGAELLHANQFCYGAARLGIPKVVTAHSDVLSWARTCRGGALEDSAWLRRYCALVQQGLDGADAVTAPTEWMLRALKGGFSVPLEQRVIPNGRAVDARDSYVRRLQAVTVGRLWDEAKDVALLKQVRSPMPLVAAGETEWNGARPYALSDVSLRGVLSEEETIRLFEESAVYLCTSRYEPFGLAPLEAALCGCAVVARRIDSLCEVWGDAALYFADAEELSRLLSELYEEEAMLREMQRRARQHARRYSREWMTQEYLALFTAMKEKAREAACVA